MLPAPLRKAGYAFVALYGLFATVAPRLASSLGVRMGLLGFENTAELEAQDWYARAVRAAGVGMLAAGGVGLLLEDRASERARAEAEAEEFDDDFDDEEIEVDVDGEDEEADADDDDSIDRV